MAAVSVSSSTSRVVRAAREALPPGQARLTVGGAQGARGRPDWMGAWWLYLHTAASYLPSRPSADEQARMTDLLRGAVRAVPCRRECRPHAERYLVRHPPRVGSRRECEDWVIGLHNSVNRRLGKVVLDGRSARLQQKRVRQLQLGLIAHELFSGAAAAADGGGPVTGGDTANSPHGSDSLGGCCGL